MIRSSIVAAALLVLASVAAISKAEAAELGKNLAGETCRSAGPLEADQPTAIACGNTTEPVGQVLFSSAPQDKTALRAALQRLAQSRNNDIDCGEPQWANDGDAELQVCALKSTGLTRIVVAMAAGSRVYRAEGPPSALPVLEAAVVDDANISQPRFVAELLGILTAKLPAGILHAATSDFARYDQLVQAGRLAAADDRFAVAESSYRQALAIAERLYGQSAMVVGQTVLELALQASNQKQFAEAAALFQRAGPIIQASADQNVRARYESYLALDAANRREYADALKFARQATAERRSEIAAAVERNAQGDAEAGVPVSQGELAHALRIEADMALRLGELANANASAQEALWILSDEPGLPMWWRADTVALVGEIDEKLGHVAAAEDDLRDARDTDKKVFGDGPPTAFSDVRLGRFYAHQQLYPAALEAFDAAFAIAEKDTAARAEISPDDIVAYADAELAAGNAATRDAEIFRAFQLVNSGAVDETIARIAAARVADNSDLSGLVSQLQAAERGRDLARVALAAEYAKSEDQRSAERENTLASSENQANARADALLTQIHERYPDYASLSDPGPAKLADAQSQLAPSEALLSFVFGNDTGYAMLIRPHGFSAVPLAIGEDTLASDVDDLRKAFVPVGGLPPEFDLKSSYQLYRTLLAPLGDQLSGVDHLIVVPGSVLSNLPLATLVMVSPTGGDYLHAAWLVRQFALSEVPSLRAFVTLKQEVAKQRIAARPFLGLGDPPFQGANGPAGEKALAALTGICRDAGPVAPELLRALPPLPDTAREVRDVGKEIGGNAAVVLLGPDASEADLRAQPLDQFSVLYFATHGILPGELHCASEPALALAPPLGRPASAADDGLLEAGEIAALKLDADLVVLSACNTAVSADGLGGGALQGLSDSFFAAGARAVMASHWDVSSAATEMLMTNVFNPSARAHGLADALRQAELQMIARPSTAHPFYWASFTLIGNSAAFGRSAQLAQREHN